MELPFLNHIYPSPGEESGESCVRNAKELNRKLVYDESSQCPACKKTEIAVCSSDIIGPSRWSRTPTWLKLEWPLTQSYWNGFTIPETPAVQGERKRHVSVPTASRSLSVSIT